MSTGGNDTAVFLRICMIVPPEVNSEAFIYDQKDPWGFLKFPLPTLELQMAFFYFGSLLFHVFLSRVGIPRFTSLAIVGIIFATKFSEQWAEKRELLFNGESQEMVGLISVFGYMLFLFYIGVKTDMSMFHKTGSNARNIGVVSILAPYLCGMAFQHFFSSKFLKPSQRSELPYITGMLSITPFPVISSVLSDLKILNSELGRLGLSSAIISEFFGMFLTSTATFVRIVREYGPYRAGMDVVAALLFIVVVIYILRPAMFWVIKQTPEGCPVNDHYVYCILILALFSAYASHEFHLYAIFGPYFFGLAVPEGPPLGTAIIKKIGTFVNGVFMPMFVITCAMRVDLRDLMTWRNKMDGKLDAFMVQTMLLVAVTFFAKFVSCVLPPLHARMHYKDAIYVSLIMCCKGIFEMGTYCFFRDISGLPDNVFALLMMTMILNATVLPMLLSILYDPLKKYAGFEKRNIMDLRNNAEFRILTCIHRPDNIPSAINLIEATYPTKEEPVGLYVLQLIELIGRATPVFICHKMQKNNPKTSFSENLVDAFENFERELEGALDVNTFTAVTPGEETYEEICTLALDKLTSLIVLPFHLKWSSDGNNVELDDKSLRDLNYSVLERAPCSVGILIEKAKMAHIFSPETPFKVCLLFIGGRDDREAFVFAKKMAKNPHVRLTMVQFLAKCSKDIGMQDWDAALDKELLKEVRINKKVGNAHVTFKQKEVEDGPETALIVRSMVNEFDLIIVGRRTGEESIQTAGLEQWSEYPELGILGDLLASTDAGGKASIFVMQQQKTASHVK